MKKIISTILLINFMLPAFAFEDYMIVSKTPVKSVTAENNKIVEVKPVFTIDNEKKIIILTPISSGKTKIIVNTTEGEKIFDIKITDKKTTIKSDEGFEYFQIDNPPEEIEIPEPPETIDVPQPPNERGNS